jgi:DNA excision repair protein ERCC-4
MSKEVIEIVVDDREQASGLVEVFSALEYVSVRIERLTLGDYLIDDRLIVERKTMADLVASIKDGRLFSQACRLADSDLLTAILLEGTAMDLANSEMRRAAIQGALINVTLYLGIPLLRSKTNEESARLMIYAAKQGRAIAQHTLPRRGRRAKGKRAVQSRILQGLPQVGPKRAKRLLDHFGSVEKTITAETEQLRKVEGIGEWVADTMRWSVQERITDYQGTCIGQASALSKLSSATCGTL